MTHICHYILKIVKSNKLISLTDEAIKSKNQLENAAQEANLEVDEYRKRLMKQGDTIREIEVRFEFILKERKSTYNINR